MLEVDSLSVHYGKHLAVDRASLRVERGEIVVLLGSNGAGKSSLLKAVAGMVRADLGARASLDGVDLLALAPHQVVERGVSLVPEGRGVFVDLSVRENLLLGAFPRRAREREVQMLARVVELFPKLAQRFGQTVSTMSGGEQQMVAIGRALMSNPDVLLLDEPSLGLSPLVCRELFAALQLIRGLGIGMLLVEQNARRSLAIADRAYVIERGAIHTHGSAQELRCNAAVQRAYLGVAA